MWRPGDSPTDPWDYAFGLFNQGDSFEDVVWKVRDHWPMPDEFFEAVQDEYRAYKASLEADE